MNGPTAPAYVRQGERVLWLGKPTLLVLFSNVLGFLVFLFFGGIFFLGNLSNDAPLLASAVPILAVLGFGVVVVLNGLRLRRTEYVVTDHGVYTRTGIIGQSVVQTTYDKITDIALRQDILGRLFGYSTLQVNTAGSNTAPVQMPGLQRALDVRQQIEQLRDTFLARGRAPAAPPAWEPAPATLPMFTLDRDIVRATCPTAKKPFKRPRTDAGKRVPCPHCGKQHILREASGGRAA